MEDADSAAIEPIELLPEPVRVQAAARVATALEAAREAIATSRLLSPDVLGDLQDVVALIAASIADSPDAALVLSA